MANSVLKRFLILTLFAVISSVDAAWSMPQKDDGKLMGHGSSSSEEKRTMLDVLKKQKLTSYLSATIGEAFDGYRHFAKSEWKEYPEPDGKVYINFTGWQRKKLFGFNFSSDAVVMRAVEVKFVVSSDGTYGVVMASRIEMKKNGNQSKIPMDNLKGLLDAIYANREIRF